MGKARAGDVSTCPKLCSQTAGQALFSLGKSPARQAHALTARPACFAKARWSVFLFQCLIVPPVTLGIRTSSFLIVHVIHPQENSFNQTSSPKPNLRNLSFMNNSASEPEKTLKVLHIFLKDFFKRCQDICTYLPVPCFSVYETRKHVQTPTKHNAGMSLRVCLPCSKHQSCLEYKSLSPCKGTELWLL